MKISQKKSVSLFHISYIALVESHFNSYSFNLLPHPLPDEEVYLCEIIKK